MPYKTCPYCQQMSYATYSENRWYCPYCAADMTDVPFIGQQETSGVCHRDLLECCYLSASFDKKEK